MTAIEKQNELYNKVLLGLDIACESLLEFKKQKKTELVVLQDGKVVKNKALVSLQDLRFKRL